MVDLLDKNEPSIKLIPAPLTTHETTDTTHVLIDPNRNLWVNFGVPIERLNGVDIIIPPKVPHVFLAHMLWVTDRLHQNFIFDRCSYSSCTR